MATENKHIDPPEGEIMDHHNYDGIEELDNPPPLWIMALFYITIAIAIIYGAYYFWLDVGDNQDAEYLRKTERHDQKFQIANLSSDELMLLTGAVDLEDGAKVYNDMNCFACHGMSGEGNAIGPNLTDEYWLHGCDFQSVFNVIKNGVPAKGMTAFKGQISDSQIQKVASYVISLKGSNPANAKAAQGELCN